MPVVVFYRRVRYGYGYRRIGLSREKFAIVDVEDYERLSRYKWCALRGRRTFYAVRSGPRRGRDGKRKMVMMHREVLRVGGGKVVDHINGDGLDNRRANLRAASRAENAWNQGKRRVKSSSRYKGVWLKKRDGKWTARIRVRGKAVHLGLFEEEVDAAKAYDAAARRYFGEFAVMNLRGDSGG